MDVRTLPRLHPHTGLELVPVGYTRRGPIWPILGASEDDDADNKTGDDKGADADDADDKAGTDTDDDSTDSDATDKPDTGKGGDDWKARSRKHEDRAKANRKAADDAEARAKAADDRLAAVLKAAGLKDGDEDEDPTVAVKKAADERDAAIAEVRSLKVERAAEKAARAGGADVDALLDSRSFIKALEQLDPTDDGFADDLKELVAKTVKASPHLKAAGKSEGKAPANADMSGGGNSSTGPKTIEDRIAARRKRRTG